MLGFFTSFRPYDKYTKIATLPSGRTQWQKGLRYSFKVRHDIYMFVGENVLSSRGLKDDDTIFGI